MPTRNTPDPRWRVALAAAIAPKTFAQHVEQDEPFAQFSALGLSDKQKARAIENGVKLEAFGGSHLVDIFARIAASNAITRRDLNLLASHGVTLRIDPERGRP